VTDIYLGLGSNLGDRRVHLRWCLDVLPSKGIRVAQVSPIYETSPVGMHPEAGLFLNAVCHGVTRLSPLGLLKAVKEMERDRGRLASAPCSSRVLDIDILLYGDSIINARELVVPHPRMFSRAFVLVPLADLAPSLKDPVTKLTVRQYLANLVVGDGTIQKSEVCEAV
jgi:2-amino-4-hydroxy-6-hydroxymethyldihydropteridine diphosphokinase